MRSWRILNIGQTELRVHPAVLFYLLYAALTDHLAFTCISFASILLHEAAHSLTSAALGQIPTCIELTPLGAVMKLEDTQSLSSWRRALVTAAGPLITLLLCRISSIAVIHRLISQNTGQLLFLSNLSILILNLLPVFPLDGGRMLLLLLEQMLPQRTAHRLIKIISHLFGIGLIVLNILFSWKYGGWNLSLAFAGCCVIYSTAVSSVSHAMAEMRYFLERKIMLERKRVIRTRCLTVLQTMPVRELVKMLPARQMAVFVCSEAGTGRILGIMHESALIQAYLDTPNLTLHQALDSKNRFDFAKSDTN